MTAKHTTGSRSVLAGLSSERFQRAFLGILGIGAAFAVWTALSHFEIVSKYALPSPSSIVGLYADQSAFLLQNIRLTLVRVLVSFVVGTTAGIMVSILTSWSVYAAVATEPIVQILKPVPALVLTPFMIIWFGARSEGIIALAIWGCFFLMLVEGREALRRTPQVFRWSATTMGASRWQLRTRVMLPSAIPHLIGALRISMLVDVNLIILGEFSAASGGVGEIIVRGYRFLRPDLLFFGVFVAAGLAVTLDVAVRIAGIRLRRWV